MAPLLLVEALPQRLHERVPAAQCLYLCTLLRAQAPLGEFLEPIRGQLAREQLKRVQGSLEMRGEGAVEAVVVRFVLDQAGTGQEIELLGIRLADAGPQRFEQTQEFGQTDRHAGLSQQKEKPNEHSVD